MPEKGGPVTAKPFALPEGSHGLVHSVAVQVGEVPR